MFFEGKEKGICIPEGQTVARYLLGMCKYVQYGYRGEKRKYEYLKIQLSAKLWHQIYF